GADGRRMQDLRGADRSGRAGAPAAAAWRRHRHRRDGHGERPAQGCKPRGLRARHVAKLDRAVISTGVARKGFGTRCWKSLETTMDLLAERGRRVSVDELNTTRLLAHARKQAAQRNLDDLVIVDVDAHHYENEHYSDILSYMENDVFRQWTMGGRGMTDRG